MIYDGVDLSRYMITNCARPLMAAPTVSTSTAAGRDGLYVSNVTLESFSVEVKCTIIPDGPLTQAQGVHAAHELKRRIASLLFRRTLCPLYFDGDPDYYCMAIVSDVSDVERTGYMEQCTVTFLCEPYFYSRPKKITITQTKAVHIAGTLPTRPVIEIVASSSADSIRLSNLDTGEFVQVNASFTKGVILRLDMENKHATINGADCAVTITSDFFELPPGKTHLHLDNGSATIIYKEVWL